ncbi:MAG: major capsid family protein [Sulfitobacter litoralis]|uniref:DUF2184 domain-containing protein n=1 Tax=Sulfitobacter litoralis TaxID=335975 RepID=UPI003001736E
MNMKVNVRDAAQAALGFAVSQQSHIETGVLKRKYPAIRYAELVPVDTSANPFAASVTHFSQDSVGKAKFINGKADDVPLVNLLREKFEQGVNLAGIGYQFSVEEIGQAQMLGQNLSSDGAEAANLAFNQLVDEVAFVGNADLGVQGLLNTTGITTSAAAKTFALSTPQEILAEINSTLTGIMTATNGVEMADTLLMPLKQYGDIATRQIAPESTMTVLQFIQASNVYTAMTGQPLTIVATHRLTNKLVAYKRDPSVVKMHMPMPLQFLAPQMNKLQILVPGMFRFAPVNIRTPAAIRYKTGL